MNPHGRGKVLRGSARVLLLLFSAVIGAGLLFGFVHLESSSVTRVASSGPNISTIKRDTLFDDDVDGVADPGETIRYGVLLTNTGSLNADGATFTDTIDANTTLNGTFWSTPIARNDVYVTNVNTALTVPAASGLFANDGDPDGQSILLSSAPNLSATGGTVTVASDGAFTYTPLLDFNGTDSFSYTIRDGDGNIDPAIVLISVIPGSGSNPANNSLVNLPDLLHGLKVGFEQLVMGGSALASGETIGVQLGTLNPGQAVGIFFEVTVDSPFPSNLSEVCNQGRISGVNFTAVVTDDPDTFPLLDPTCRSVDVPSAPDLQITKDDGGVTAVPGDTILYTLTYSNAGNQNAAGVTITETVPADTTFNPTDSSTGWTCSPDASAGSTCILGIGTVAGSGGDGQVLFAVDVDSPFPAGVPGISNTATIGDDGSSGPDPNPGDNSASITTPVDAAPDLQITKHDGGLTVQPGDTLSYTLAFTDPGNQDAKGVFLTEIVPAYTSFNDGASTSGWSCSQDDVGATTCTFPYGTLAGNGGNDRVVFTVDVDDPLQASVTEIINTASIDDDGSGGPDPNPGDNTASITTPVDTGPVADANGPYSGLEGSPIPLNGSGSTDDTAIVLYEWDCTNDGTNDASSTSPIGNTCTYPDDGSFTLRLRVTDAGGQTGEDTAGVLVANVAPAVTITAPPSFAVSSVGDPIHFTASFTDPGVLDTHTAEWFFNAATIQGPITLPGTVTQTSGGGTVDLSTSFTTPGVYSVVLTVTDDDGGVGTAATVNNDLEARIVIYDPDGGFVTGGGWIDSPAGVYTPDPTLTGRATFGFVSKYKQGKSTPDGSTQFQFRTADLVFHSSSYDWLVIAGARAQYRGTGTINGMGNFGFMLTAIDADTNTNDGFDADRFRMRIWDKDNNDVVVYDNQLACSDVSVDADPCTDIGGGSIVIHKAKKSN